MKTKLKKIPLLQITRESSEERGPLVRLSKTIQGKINKKNKLIARQKKYQVYFFIILVT